MSIFNGKKLNIEIFGTSHDKEIGGKIFGFPKVKIDYAKLNSFLDRRKPLNKNYLTARKEDDIVNFAKIKDDVIDGEFSFTITNKDINKDDYKDLYGKPRPSHADYSWYLKDKQYDFSGGGRFSGRLTAPLCVVGGLCKQLLESKGIFVLGYISEIGKVKGTSYKDRDIKIEEALSLLEKDFPAIKDGNKMEEEILNAKNSGDSVGGKVECIVYNMQGGVGDNLFGGLEGKISSLIYSIPAVKGVEFGLGFDFAKSIASNVNDELSFEDGKIKLLSNNNGGINGGIANGEKITIGVAIKPTPSIAKEQRTVDLINSENVKIKIAGRHDACIVPRAVACVESAVAIALVDELEF